MSELAHVYQNRSDGYAIEDMYFCESCNGYYGVPHDFDHKEHQREWGRHPDCACRFHREEAGLPREGDWGRMLDMAAALELVEVGDTQKEDG